MSYPQPKQSGASATANSASDRRKHKRVPLRLPGRFLNDESEDFTLLTENMSCSGAMIISTNPPPDDTPIVCYFDDIGRVAATVVRRTPNGFAVTFRTSDHKRDKLADRLTWLVNKDALKLTDDRATKRFDAGGPALVVLKDGRQLQCRVVDISLAGASFETDGGSPKMGEEIVAGNLRGEVVRVEKDSFAIRYIR
ncbi:MAG: PilZ domain-containing protein [Hyphomonas sp.]